MERKKVDPKKWPGIGLSGEQTVDVVRERWGPSTLVSFSCGKDSCAAYFAVRSKFDRAVPYYLYLVPDLEFVDETLDYFERYHMDEPIVRMPHPTLYQMLGNRVFQPPAHLPVIDAARFRLCRYNYNDAQIMVIDDKGLPDHTMDAVGIRAADSLMRRTALKSHGSITLQKYRYFPVWDWSKQDVIDCMRKHNVRLPVDYDLFGRSFDGIDSRFLAPLKRHRPRDYQKILEWFPMAEVEIFRLEKFGGFTV